MVRNLARPARRRRDAGRYCLRHRRPGGGRSNDRRHGPRVRRQRQPGQHHRQQPQHQGGLGGRRRHRRAFGRQLDRQNRIPLPRSGNGRGHSGAGAEFDDRGGLQFPHHRQHPARRRQLQVRSIRHLGRVRRGRKMTRIFGALSARWRRAGDGRANDARRRCRSGGLSPATADARTLPRAALLAGVSLLALAPNAARAVDGTWTGPGAEWTDGTNWSSTPDVPDDTATFGNNAAPTSVAISNDASINTIQFTAAAPAFNFTTSGTRITFDVNGAGIVNNSAFAPTFINNDNLNFNNASSAGNAVIVNNNGAVLSFNNNSTAANAIITTNDGALTQFNDNSTGGNAQFITNSGGVVDFSNTSGPNGDGNISAGSIAGAGNYYLGSNLLTVGGNNLSTPGSGGLSDCGDSGSDCSNAGATGGGLIKIGTGTLTLSGANTYTGPTA